MNKKYIDKDKMNDYYNKKLDDYMKRVKKDKMNTEAYVTTNTICWANPISFAPCIPQVTNTNTVPCQKGNNPMYVDNDKHIESSKINYLTDRACSVYFHKSEELPAKFGFQTSKTPSTTQGLIDAFVKGMFKIKDVANKDKEGFYYRPMENILFVDPSVVEDPVGLKAANAAFQVVYQDTKDAIAIGTPAEGLAAVKAMDAWTPTKTVTV